MPCNASYNFCAVMDTLVDQVFVMQLGANSDKYQSPVYTAIIKVLVLLCVHLLNGY